MIHIEQQWAENVHTAVGELMHKKVHDPELTEKRKGLIIARALPIASREMGVNGECDVVEFHQCEDGVRLYGHRGLYSVFPVEYKKGKPKLTEEDQLQLAAQAMCLEEMFSTKISAGRLFFTERPDGANGWKLQKNCGRRYGKLFGKCTIIMTENIRLR